MNTKLLNWIVVVALAVSISACGKSEKEKSAENSKKVFDQIKTDRLAD